MLDFPWFCGQSQSLYQWGSCLDLIILSVSLCFGFFCFFQLVIYSIARFHCLFHVRVIIVNDRRGAPLAVVIRLSREAVLLSFLPKQVLHHFESM